MKARYFRRFTDQSLFVLTDDNLLYNESLEEDGSLAKNIFYCNFNIQSDNQTYCINGIDLYEVKCPHPYYSKMEKINSHSLPMNEKQKLDSKIKNLIEEFVLSHKIGYEVEASISLVKDEKFITGISTKVNSVLKH